MQVAPAHIDYNVSVSQELREEFRGTERSKRRRGAMNEGSFGTCSTRCDLPVARQGFIPVQLRRDGTRPLRFTGAPLLAVHVGERGGPDGFYGLFLFAATGDRIIAQVVAEPSAGTRWLPVFRADAIDSPGAVQKMIREASLACGNVSLAATPTGGEAEPNEAHQPAAWTRLDSLTTAHLVSA